MCHVHLISGLQQYARNLVHMMSSIHWPQLASAAQFPQKPPDLVGLIISGTKMTNNGPFLLNGSSKIQFFTDIWYLLEAVEASLCNFF